MIKGRLKKGQRFRIIKGWDGDGEHGESLYSAVGDIVIFQRYVGWERRVICKFEHIVKTPGRSTDIDRDDASDVEFYGFTTDWDGIQQYLLGHEGPGTEGWIFKRDQLGPENVDYALEQELDAEEDLL